MPKALFFNYLGSPSLVHLLDARRIPADNLEDAAAKLSYAAMKVNEQSCRIHR